MKKLTIAKACLDQISDIENYATWLTVPLFILYVVSGYSLTRWHILPKDLAIFFHMFICSILLTLVLLHVLARARTFFFRHNMMKNYVNVVLILIGLVILSLITYIELWR